MAKILDFWANLWYIFHDKTYQVNRFFYDAETVNRGLRFLAAAEEKAAAEGA